VRQLYARSLVPVRWTKESMTRNDKGIDSIVERLVLDNQRVLVMTMAIAAFILRSKVYAKTD
jgi:hypothetical protein